MNVCSCWTSGFGSSLDEMIEYSVVEGSCWRLMRWLELHGRDLYEQVALVVNFSFLFRSS